MTDYLLKLISFKRLVDLIKVRRTVNFYTELDTTIYEVSYKRYIYL